MNPRRCAGCGASARSVHRTYYRVNGIPMGSSFRYACSGCASEFELLSTARLIILTLSTAFMASIGGLLIYLNVAHPSRRLTDWFMPVVATLVALFSAWSLRRDLATRLRHPTLPRDQR